MNTVLNGNGGNMLQHKKEKLERELCRKRERLHLYLEMEKKILTGSPQSYNIGSRSKTNYSMTPDQIRDAIKTLEDEIAELEGLLSGVKARKVISIIPRF